MPSAAVGSGRLGIRASSACRSRSACGLLGLGRGQFVGEPLAQLGDLLRAGRAPLDDRFWAARSASARSVSSRHGCVGGEQRVEVVGGAAPGQRGTVAVRILPGGLQVNHLRESSAHTQWHRRAWPRPAPSAWASPPPRALPNYSKVSATVEGTQPRSAWQMHSGSGDYVNASSM